MFRRWAESRMYRNTMLLAVRALRGAPRTPNALEKLRLLDVAEQKLRDAHWLRPDVSKERFDAGLKEIARSRQRTLKQQAFAAVGKLLEAVEKGVGEKGEMLRAAGEILAFLYHYLPDDPETQQLGARFRSLEGEQRPYRPEPALADHYHRPAPGAGCGAMIGGLLVLSLLLWWCAAIG
jgi:hypothetical protein